MVGIKNGCILPYQAVSSDNDMVMSDERYALINEGMITHFQLTVTSRANF